MASLSRHGDVFHVRFRFARQSFRRSLQTTEARDAQAALNLVEHTLHRLHVGWLQIPAEVGRGDFIVSGGTLRPGASLKRATSRELTQHYLQSEERRIAETFVASKKTHLNHLLELLGKRADQPASQVSLDDLRDYQNARCGQVQQTRSTRRW